MAATKRENEATHDDKSRIGIQALWPTRSAVTTANGGKNGAADGKTNDARRTATNPGSAPRHDRQPQKRTAARAVPPTVKLHKTARHNDQTAHDGENGAAGGEKHTRQRDTTTDL